MKPTLLITTAAFALAACASGTTAPPATPAPQPAPAVRNETPPPPPAAAPAPAAPEIREAPSNWQLLDATADRVPGISAERAIRELLSGKQPKRTVVVAVVDGGVDTAHVDLRANLWKNPKEIAGNGKDDDGNGYVDDVYGWNFIGGRSGEDVRWDTFEVTRQHVACMKAATAGTQPPAAVQRCERIAADYEQKKEEAEGTLAQIGMIDNALTQIMPLLRQALGTQEVTADAVRAFSPANQSQQQAKALFLQLADNDITPEVIAEAKEAYESQVKYGLDLSFDPRSIVGDNYANVNEHSYGNNDVMGPDAKHGTHVAGIIGAIRGNGTGIDGIATSVKLMVVRTVPDGDERDKDVANAIRYAVDNGANVVNMSFGKSYSPFKPAVDEAVKYAESKGVLLVHAAGNDGEDLSANDNFPTPVLDGGVRAKNWIEVGASSWKGGENLAAPFSNWGTQQVDVFAPGVDILSTVPGGGYKREDGTSMAAPVVSGLAALIMAYYPDLTPADVRDVIMRSATSYGQQMVVRPGAAPGEPQVPFATLSVTGGVVNAFEALRLAEQVAAGKRISN